MAESDFEDLPSSPPIENLLGTIPSVKPSIKDSYESEYNGKRVKHEHEEYDRQKVPHSTKRVIDDDCEAFGHNVAAQLRQMSKIQKILAQRIMSEVCFRGQINAIQRHTWLTTPTNPVQQYQPKPFFNARKPFTNGGADCLMAQNTIRYQTHVPANGNHETAIHCPSNLVNNMQQSNQSQNSMGTTVNTVENVKKMLKKS